MNKEEFVKRVSSLGLNLTTDMLEKLSIYISFLIEYNKHTNLTAITEINDIYLKHFYDSLTILKSINLSNYNNLIDIGTGAGFPGMVLAICFPNLKVTLLDSNNKKTKFLEELKKKLEINNITIINDRAENYAKTHLDSFDIATSRAVTTLEALTEISLPYVKVDGYFIPLKGESQDEINWSKDIISTLNGKIEDIIKFNLYNNEQTRTIIKIKKLKETPNGYPRNYNIIKKAVEKRHKIK